MTPAAVLNAMAYIVIYYNSHSTSPYLKYFIILFFLQLILTTELAHGVLYLEITQTFSKNPNWTTINLILSLKEKKNNALENFELCYVN